MKVATIMKAVVSWACGHTYAHKFEKPMSKAEVKLLKKHASTHVCQKCEEAANGSDSSNDA